MPNKSEFIECFDIAINALFDTELEIKANNITYKRDIVRNSYNIGDISILKSFLSIIKENLRINSRTRSHNACDFIPKETLDKLLYYNNSISLVEVPSKANQFYIPILRGLRTLKPNENVYADRTLNDYFKNNKEITHNNIFTGESLFKTLQSKLLGKPNDRQNVKDFEIFLKDHFFKNDKDLSIIPAIDQNNDVVEIFNGIEQRKIYELGDGIQNLIVLLFQVFMNADKECIFLLKNLN